MTRMAATRRTITAAALPMALKPAEHRLLLTGGDALAAVLAVVIALWLWSIPAGWTFSLALIRQQAAWFLAAGLWVVAVSLPANARTVSFSLRRTTAALLRGALLLLAAYAAWYFYAPRGVLPRLVTLYFLWEATLLTLAWRVVFVAVFSAPRFRRRAILVGAGEPAAIAVHLFKEVVARQTLLVGCVDTGTGLPQTVAAAERLSSDALVEGVERLRASEIVLALDAAPPAGLVEQLLVCQEAGAVVSRVQALVEELEQRVPVRLLEPDWLLTDLADAMRLREASWWMKRGVDFAGAAIGLVAAAPLVPLVAAAIRLDSRGPVFYRQRRLGRGGVPFTVVKFRTMTLDAEQPGEARWAERGDPRATRIGSLLRRTHLDELPQLINVLKGDMSLVGPRPERPEFVERLEQAIPFYRARLMVPPGLTGWAQVNLPYGDSVESAREKLEYDLYYVKHRSLLFDVFVIARTAGAIFRLGAH
jgi:exopolysaccharide biosynthesis polyprenyl glycosylphosphotransferase